MATLYAYSPNGTQATLSYSVIGFTQSLQQNGWCKLPNGLIFQWLESLTDNNTVYVNLPISFSSIILSLNAAQAYYSEGGCSAVRNDASLSTVKKRAQFGYGIFVWALGL